MGPFSHERVSKAKTFVSFPSMKSSTGKSFILSFCGLVSSVFFAFSCTRQKAELGTDDNPIKLYFVPAVDAKVIEANSQKFKTYLETATGYKFQVSIPQSYIAVVE